MILLAQILMEFSSICISCPTHWWKYQQNLFLLSMNCEWVKLSITCHAIGHLQIHYWFSVWCTKEEKFQVFLTVHCCFLHTQWSIHFRLILYRNSFPRQVYTVVHPTHVPREYWIIYRWPGFLAIVWFGSSPTPLSSQQVVSLSQSSCVSPVEIKCRRGGGGGAGEEPNHTTAKKPGPLYIIQYSLHEKTKLNFLNTSTFCITLLYRLVE